MTWQIKKLIQEFICDTNKKFIVVGAIGSQGNLYLFYLINLTLFFRNWEVNNAKFVR